MITIYGTTNCKYCELTKKYFDDKNVTYTYIDVTDNPELKNKLREITGRMGVPVVRFNDEWHLGYQPELFDTWLTK